MPSNSLSFLLAAQLVAQPIAPPLQPNVVVAAPAPWNPAAPYITVGQDDVGYRSWYMAIPARAAQVRMFSDYLDLASVQGVLPTWQLFRTASSWQSCGAEPFEIPPTSEWPHIIQTLRYIRDYVIPAVGPVEAVSGYRNPSLNACAGGAPESAHKHYSAVDLVPLHPMTREGMMHALCGDHSRHGAAYGAGLGFYAFMRFHIDSTKFRRWNMDPAVAAQCPALIHPEDLATIGQPLPPVETAPVVAPTVLPVAQPDHAQQP